MSSKQGGVACVESLIALIKKFADKLAELEEERDVLLAFIIKRVPTIRAMSTISEISRIIAGEVDSLLEAHNLEQQAIGIEVAVRINVTSYSEPYTKKLMARAAELRKQAKALKEPKP
jgi:UDP-N-acetyl-D-mannosaminuronate dehydrogenase